MNETIEKRTAMVAERRAAVTVQFELVSMRYLSTQHVDSKTPLRHHHHHHQNVESVSNADAVVDI